MTLQELNAHWKLKQQLAESEEILFSLHQSASPKSQVLTGLPHAPGIKDTVGELAAEIVEIERDIERMRCKIAASEQKIACFISSIDDPNTRVIFRLRYLHGLTWKEVAAVLGRFQTEASVKSTCYRYMEQRR